MQCLGIRLRNGLDWDSLMRHASCVLFVFSNLIGEFVVSHRAPNNAGRHRRPSTGTRRAMVAASAISIFTVLFLVSGGFASPSSPTADPPASGPRTTAPFAQPGPIPSRVGTSQAPHLAPASSAATVSTPPAAPPATKPPKQEEPSWWSWLPFWPDPEPEQSPEPQPGPTVPSPSGSPSASPSPAAPSGSPSGSPSPSPSPSAPASASAPPAPPSPEATPITASPSASPSASAT